MKRFSNILLLLFILTVYNGFGQQVIPSSEPELKFHFDQKDFGDKFCVAADNDDTYNYFVINLEKLPDRFEKIYFLNLVYSNNKVVNIDGEIDKSQLWFKSYYKNTEDDIICLMNDMKKETHNVSLDMSETDKKAWMAKYDKYSK
jgi:hypothetical protein